MDNEREREKEGESVRSLQGLRGTLRDAARVASLFGSAVRVFADLLEVLKLGRRQLDLGNAGSRIVLGRWQRLSALVQGRSQVVLDVRLFQQFLEHVPRVRVILGGRVHEAVLPFLLDQLAIRLDLLL